MKTLFSTCGAAIAAALLVMAAPSQSGANDVTATPSQSSADDATDTPSQPSADERITTLADVPEDFEFHPLPPGEGVDEVYYGCIACHSLRTVTNGGYSRAVWDELLDWMVDDQGMMEPEPDIREVMLDYLATYIGEDWEG